MVDVWWVVEASDGGPPLGAPSPSGEPSSVPSRRNTCFIFSPVWLANCWIDCPPVWMMLRNADSGMKELFFSSSKMICARVMAVRSSLLLLSTILTSSPVRIISAI